MKILWVTWKDFEHPQAGGAELINEEIIKRLSRDGHEVILLTSRFHNSEHKITKDGYKIIRVGNRYTVYWQAYRYYKKTFVGWADLVIDEMNTIPFFCKYYVKEPQILLAYQLCREVWFYQARFPINIIGYFLEPLYLRMLSSQKVITESESAKQDMSRYGFSVDKIKVMRIGVNTAPIENLQNIEKFPHPTLLSLGSIRSMKRTLHQVKAFEIAKAKIPNLRLIIGGNADSTYGRKVLRRIKLSKYSTDIEYMGRVSDQEKADLMLKSHLILVTSIKEGWGLIVTEANCKGTPAAVYDVDGLRDSVKNGVTGQVSEINTPTGLANTITELLSDTEAYEQMREKAWQWSHELTLENCYQDFRGAIAHFGLSSEQTRTLL